MPVPASRTTVTFKVRAETSFGDSLVLIGSGDALGNWDPWNKGIPLTTTEKDYPLWTTSPIAFSVPESSIEYKYVRLTTDNQAQWEADGTNRKLPEKGLSTTSIVMDDGAFGHIVGMPFAFPEGVNVECPRLFSQDAGAGGLRLVVAGDSITAGWGSTGLNGWAAQLGKTLKDKWGYGYANVAGMSCDASKLLANFEETIVPLKPTVVVIAVSQELERTVKCPDWDRMNICNHMLKCISMMVDKVWEMGAVPVVGGPYAHSEYQEEQVEVVRHAERSLRDSGVPVLDWLNNISNNGKELHWQDNLSHSPATPDEKGHYRMFQAIDPSIFDPAKVKQLLEKKAKTLDQEVTLFTDGNGFTVKYTCSKESITVENKTKNPYTLSPGWGALQDSMAQARRAAPWSLKKGVYMTTKLDGPLVSVGIGQSGRFSSEADIPAGATVTMVSTTGILQDCKPLFHDGPLAVLFDKETKIIRIINEADCEYNVHPMWAEFRKATRKLPEGIYEDDSGAPFRTAVVSVHGVQSRVKVLPNSAIALKYKGELSSMKRVAVLPLGDRCSIRMLLHKIELDGPCYPFDLTRTTSLADVTDMVATGFKEMWQEELLWYDNDAGRVFHRKWGGLSFAHEVEWETGDDPIGNFHPIAQRMAKRYAGRAARFDYAIGHADEVMFIRTGCASRGEVENCLTRLKEKYPGIKCRMMLISDQNSHEFEGLSEKGLTHIQHHFDPDRMYEEMQYWIHSAHQFRGMLERNGINARNLYWCPNNLKEADAEIAEAKKAYAALASSRNSSGADLHGSSKTVDRAPGGMPSREANYSHSNLYDVEQRLPPRLRPEQVEEEERKTKSAAARRAAAGAAPDRAIGA